VLRNTDAVTGTDAGAPEHTELDQRACASQTLNTSHAMLSEVSHLINYYEGSTLFIGSLHNLTIIYRSDAITACTSWFKYDRD
jgi:hypothetical protein